MLRRLRLGLGLGLILGGLGLGLYVGISFAAGGIQSMSDGHVAQGILMALLWSELLGIGTACALILPGIVVLKGLGQKHRGAAS